MKDTIKYIEKLTSIPSPTGFTQEVMEYIKSEANKMGYEAFMTNKGGVMVTVEGQDKDKHRMLTAHVECVTLMSRVK